RELANHLEHGDIPNSVLQKTLQYAAYVLDTVSMDETRRLLDEEDELAEVQPDAVPNEVRQWLASTFTRSQVATKPRSDDKPKFRSVANAIRAGIMVDRIYRRLFNVTAIGIPPEVSTFLKAADEWSFDVFALNVLSPNKVLRNLSAELLNRYGLVHKFKIPSSQLDGFLSAIEQGYMKYGNPYHNNLHAADVTQTVHYMLWVTGLAQWLTDLEVFATLIAAIIHDYQHTGTTNNFHINSNSDITLLYNDRSVLENFHISEAFKVMRKDEANIIQNLSREEYREFRTLIIEMVIATDMSTHFQQVKTLKTLLSHTEFSVDKQKGLSYILHSADISHPSKMFPLHQRWTLLLMEEFFRQGDMEQELGLAYSPLCDRNSTLIPQSQIGFIDFIVAPTMELCGDLIERVHEHINVSFIDFIVAPTMELCGDLIERVHEHINVSAAAAASEAAADDQVAELAAETKSQARSQSSADSTATAKANGSSGPPSSSNTSR
ncbi:PREDICTED: calcium/calmodulin-dependent 3',5'-cyclic nucleotide phosphodiesterase 1C-like, partial [Rhagoletis zephyria]|uniref:calcium/calmodulin-dependent 3',5'-cyclic nucleotide phosphodiesterase 1C-like n=1 Tax=Rhagoletis zephyria TaxID=28612 RepID=UPI000811645F